MTSSIIFFIFVAVISALLLLINIALAPHNPYAEKNNPFECGFLSFLWQNRIQFSISFFIFALLFLLFDLEILLVYPYLVSSYGNEIYGLITMLFFLLVLVIGFAFELGKKALTIESRQTRKEPFASKKVVLVDVDVDGLGLIGNSREIGLIDKKTDEYIRLAILGNNKIIYDLLKKISDNFTFSKLLLALITISLVAFIKLKFNENFKEIIAVIALSSAFLPKGIGYLKDILRGNFTIKPIKPIWGDKTIMGPSNSSDFPEKSSKESKYVKPGTNSVIIMMDGGGESSKTGEAANKPEGRTNLGPKRKWEHVPQDLAENLEEHVPQDLLDASRDKKKFRLVAKHFTKRDREYKDVIDMIEYKKLQDKKELDHIDEVVEKFRALPIINESKTITELIDSSWIMFNRVNQSDFVKNLPLTDENYKIKFYYCGLLDTMINKYGHYLKLENAELMFKTLSMKEMYFLADLLHKRAQFCLQLVVIKERYPDIMTPTGDSGSESEGPTFGEAITFAREQEQANVDETTNHPYDTRINNLAYSLLNSLELNYNKIQKISNLIKDIELYGDAWDGEKLSFKELTDLRKTLDQETSQFSIGIYKRLLAKFDPAKLEQIDKQENREPVKYENPQIDWLRNKITNTGNRVYELQKQIEETNKNIEVEEKKNNTNKRLVEDWKTEVHVKERIIYNNVRTLEKKSESLRSLIKEEEKKEVTAGPESTIAKMVKENEEIQKKQLFQKEVMNNGSVTNALGKKFRKDCLVGLCLEIEERKSAFDFNKFIGLLRKHDMSEHNRVINNLDKISKPVNASGFTETDDVEVNGMREEVKAAETSIEEMKIRSGIDKEKGWNSSHMRNIKATIDEKANIIRHLEEIRKKPD